MYEENRRFNWAGLFIKVIIVIIFILFTVWLLSLSNKGVSNSLDVLTDNIFAENIEKMKEVGKSYFTTERLPEKVGEVNKITLDRMYDKKLILELKDKYGKTCSGDNSYVSIQKMENEYQMKVYLECGKKSDYIVTILGCYNYCDADLCEKQEQKGIEYEYKKTIGGYWTNWGNFSDWSKVSVSKTNYRDVETKVTKEDYTYEKNVTETKFKGNATCVDVANYTLISNKNGVCTYSKIVTETKNPICPEVNRSEYTGRNGFTCNYVTDSMFSKDPVCPEVSGYTKTSQNGFTCTYSKQNNSTKSPVCPEVSGYTKTSQNGFTCTYSKTVTDTNYTLQYSGVKSGSYIPADTDTYHYVKNSADYVYDCNSTCAFKWNYIYTVYKKVYGTVTKTTTAEATCPSGYKQSGNTCVIQNNVLTTTREAECSTGFVKEGNKCAYHSLKATTAEATCPSGYKKSGNTCSKSTTSNSSITKNAVCSSNQTMKNGKCYEDVTSKVKVTDKKDVTYYRYRLRDFVGGTQDYKWSTSNNDKSLLNAGYTLTGKTRDIGGNK